MVLSKWMCVYRIVYLGYTKKAADFQTPKQQPSPSPTKRGFVCSFVGYWRQQTIHTHTNKHTQHATYLFLSIVVLVVGSLVIRHAKEFVGVLLCGRSAADFVTQGLNRILSDGLTVFNFSIAGNNKETNIYSYTRTQRSKNCWVCRRIGLY